MLDSIYIARTGLQGFEDGLRAIANNTANINTPGFKGSTTRFADMFYGQNPLGGSGHSSFFGQYGNGLKTLGTTLDFKKGQFQGTGGALDLAIDRNGFFTLRDSNGAIHYTQDGQFEFNAEGTLVSVTTGEEVMGMDKGGALVPISLTNLQTNPAKATSVITFSGNLSAGATTGTVSNVTVVDASGTTHTLVLSLAAVAGSQGSWTATLKDGATTVGTSTLTFLGGQPTAATSTLNMTYTPSGGQAMSLALDFSANVTSFDSGSTSTLVVAKQDGYGFGSLTGKTFDSTGTLVLTYSNSQTVKNKQLSLAQFRSEADIAAIGGNEFAAQGSAGWDTGVAGMGQFGKIQAGQVEMSNVDLSQEFSNLVIMQRGYQACAQVVTTCSEMLTTLYGMGSK